MTLRRTADHGSISEYSNHRCRCDACCDTWRAYRRAQTRASQALIERHRREYLELLDTHRDAQGVPRKNEWRRA